HRRRREGASVPRHPDAQAGTPRLSVMEDAMMRCRRATRWMVTALDGELPARRRRALDGHVARCPACRHEMATTAAVLQGDGGRRVVAQAPTKDKPPLVASRERGGPQATATVPAEPPPELAAAPELFVDLPLLRNMEKLEHFETIRTTTLDDGEEQSNG